MKAIVSKEIADQVWADNSTHFADFLEAVFDKIEDAAAAGKYQTVVVFPPETRSGPVKHILSDKLRELGYTTYWHGNKLEIGWLVR